MCIAQLTPSYTSFTATQLLPPPIFKLPYLGNYSTLPNFSFRIKFLGNESIYDKALCFGVRVLLNLHPPTHLSLPFSSYNHQSSNNHILGTIHISPFFLSESNSWNMKVFLTWFFALVYVYCSTYTLLHVFHCHSVLTTTNLQTTISWKLFNFTQFFFQNKIPWQ